MTHELTTTLSRTAFPESGGETDLRVEVDVAESAQTLPANIVFCLDTSGSMSGGKLTQAVEGTERALGELDADDQFGIVTFDNDSRVVVEPTPGDDAGEVSLSNVSSGGGTHIVDGLSTAADLLASMRSEEAVDWIALVTDGRPSDDVRLTQLIPDIGDPGGTVERHEHAAEELNDRGMTINTAGVGSDYGADVIEALSVRSGGTWDHRSSADGVESFFREQIREAHEVVGANPVLRFEPRNGTTVDSVARTVPQMSAVDTRQEGDTLVVDDVPELRRDLAPEYLFELSVPPHEIAPAVEVAAVELRIDGKTLTDHPAVEFTVDAEMAASMDCGIAEVEEESETVANYLGQKDDLDKERREKKSRQIALKRE